RLDRWTAEMRRNGRVVLRTNLFKTIVWGLVCWLFVGASIVMFTVNAGSWNPLSDDFGGWLVFFFLLVFAAGFVLFGLGAVLWTFIFPLVRPQLVVSRWGVEASWWKPGGRPMRCAAPWTGDVSQGGPQPAGRTDDTVRGPVDGHRQPGRTVSAEEMADAGRADRDDHCSRDHR